jgi:hypothetical protein
MRELVLLVEEPSAKALLEGLLPRMLDASITMRLIAFEGKQDLEKQLTRKLRRYVNPRARFLVLRDQDSNPDCKAVKLRLVDLCESAGKHAVSLVRIACRELESMYLADLQAVEAALGMHGLAAKQNTARLRQPDRLESPSQVLSLLTAGLYQKVGGSRQLGPHLDLTNQRSASFKNLVSGIQRLEAQLLALPE